ncbi:hypothetical protein Riv7116_0944 [Rivularia sp. PCC 7116]|nr:hypothetical protein Riv7116_0944 [Rivularia sp. PCC 7116]
MRKRSARMGEPRHFSRTVGTSAFLVAPGKCTVLKIHLEKFWEETLGVRYSSPKLSPTANGERERISPPKFSQN